MTKAKPKRKRKGKAKLFVTGLPMPRLARYCVKPGCERRAEHPHHVTYRPPCVVLLCSDCHREITVVNINEAERTRQRLSNRHRWWAYGQWLRGELRPVMTANAERWLRSWRP